MPWTYGLDRRLLATSVRVLVLCGCDPGLTVDLHVVGQGGMPATGVAVRVDCPPKGTANFEDSLDLGTTDSEGWIHYQAIGSLATDCWIHVSEGPPGRVLVTDVCEHDHLLHGCLAIRGRLELSPGTLD